VAVSWRWVSFGAWRWAGHTTISILVLLVLLLIRRAQQQQINEMHRMLDYLVREIRARPQRKRSLEDFSDTDLRRLQLKIQRLRKQKTDPQRNGSRHHLPSEEKGS
jgi:low affinity Fe/Cu permease